MAGLGALKQVAQLAPLPILATAVAGEVTRRVVEGVADKAVNSSITERYASTFQAAESLSQRDDLLTERDRSSLNASKEALAREEEKVKAEIKADLANKMKPIEKMKARGDSPPKIELEGPKSPDDEIRRNFEDTFKHQGDKALQRKKVDETVGNTVAADIELGKLAFERLKRAASPEEVRHQPQKEMLTSVDRVMDMMARDPEFVKKIAGPRNPPSLLTYMVLGDKLLQSIGKGARVPESSTSQTMAKTPSQTRDGH